MSRYQSGIRPTPHPCVAHCCITCDNWLLYSLVTVNYNHREL